MAIDPPAKKLHTSSSNCFSEESPLTADPSNTDEGESNSKPGNVRNLILRYSLYLIFMQGISNLIACMILQMFSFMNTLFKNEADDNMNTKCACKRLSCTLCCNDCLQLGLVCDLCFIEAHTTNPTHWVHQWNGEYFTKLDMSALGHITTLGHRGCPCPSVEYQDPSNLSRF